MNEVPARPLDLGFSEDEFDSWRPFQRATVQRIVDAEPNAVMVVSAPTGIGKSLIALGVGRVEARRQRITTVLTHQRSLQHQYLEYELYPRVEWMMGRDNFECILPGAPEGTPTSEAPCVRDHYKCAYAWSEDGGEPDCLYYKQKYRAGRAPIRVLNYPYYFLQARQGGFRTDTLVCDEGHRLDKAVLQAATVHFTAPMREQIETWNLGPPPVPRGSLLGDYPAVSEWASSLIMQCDHASRSANEIERMLAVGINREAGTLHWLCRVGATVICNGWQFVPAIPEEVASGMLYQGGGGVRWPNRLVVMSASIFDASYTAARLGADPERAQFIDLPSAFPASRRPIYVRPVAKMNMTSTKDNTVLNELTAAIDAIAGRYRAKRGVVHCGSYALGIEIANRSTLKDRIVLARVGDTRFEEYRARADAIYISPSAYEGLDLKDDLCRFNIVAKLSWPNRGDAVTAIQLERIAGFNEFETASALVQALGRGMRHDTDWCHNFILDATFWILWGRVKDKLPKWVRDAVIFEPRKAERG